MPKETRRFNIMTDPENDSQEYQVQCSECQAGILKRRSLTYYTWLDEELITVPNFPAWVCDMCGRREYDPRAISWLNTLLNPAAGRRVSARRKSGPAHIDLPPA
jgi:YgiT-type zinc finger domain-containing protein